ncbi:MAG: hypothetical protein FWH14_05195 [Oscillospiraceae bacterium]|nr:hypothetical protein [Oscillospiraceae bacterium]
MISIIHYGENVNGYFTPSQSAFRGRPPRRSGGVVCRGGNLPPMIIANPVYLLGSPFGRAVGGNAD